MALFNLRRVYREVQDVNNDFHSLRTVVRPKADNMNKWNFIMFPNDGAMSHLPLVGELIIPESYPTDPPVLHLFTRTFRYNVDVFSGYVHDDKQSTMCFDILRSKAQNGKWERQFTISCLFESLMQALVTPRVPQEYDEDRLEFVTMEKLAEIKRAVRATVEKHKDVVGALPEIPIIRGTPIPAKPFVFIPGTRSQSLTFQRGYNRYISQPIYLQEPHTGEARSTVLDLNNLHAGVVFSVILSNKRGEDLIGQQLDTILLRNGVTGTAAKKLSQEKILWFYHGKPLNDGQLSVCITVTQDQFTMSYQTDGSPKDAFIIHGDTPISKLGKAQIGNVKGMPFYLTIFFNLKYGQTGFVNVLYQKGLGYIHSPEILSPRSALPLYVGLELSGEQTRTCQNLLDAYDVGKEFKIQRSVKQPAHQTLVYHKDLPESQYSERLNTVYTPLKNQHIRIRFKGIVADNKCVALLTDTPLAPNGEEIPVYPKGRIMHVTMRLRDSSIPPVYSNDLAKRILANEEKGSKRSGDVYIKFPEAFAIDCPLKFYHRS